jgi:hypothetical protein
MGNMLTSFSWLCVELTPAPHVFGNGISTGTFGIANLYAGNSSQQIVVWVTCEVPAAVAAMRIAAPGGMMIFPST